MANECCRVDWRVRQRVALFFETIKFMVVFPIVSNAADMPIHTSCKSLNLQGHETLWPWCGARMRAMPCQVFRSYRGS